MSFSRAFQWYHSHLDPIWPDGTFNTHQCPQRGYCAGEVSLCKVAESYYLTDHFNLKICSPTSVNTKRRFILRGCIHYSWIMFPCKHIYIHFRIEVDVSNVIYVQYVCMFRGSNTNLHTCKDISTKPTIEVWGLKALSSEMDPAEIRLIR